MGVAITDGQTVALYDNTTGEAFGPLFDGEQAAQDFLDWLGMKYSNKEVFLKGNEELRFVDDPRIYRGDELQFVYHLWQEENDGGDSGH